MYCLSRFNKFSIIFVLLALVSHEALSNETNANKIQWYKAHYLLLAHGLCEFKPALSADWLQIAATQIKQFDVKHPTKTDLVKHALDFNPGSSYFLYYSVPADTPILQTVLKQHFYLITDKAVREIDVRIQGTLIYWETAKFRDNYGSLVFDCGKDEYMGFVIASTKSLRIRSATPSPKIIEKFNSTNIECGKSYKSGLIIDLISSESPYLVASYDFTNKECKEPCEHLELLKVSGTDVTSLDRLDVCDI